MLGSQKQTKANTKKRKDKEKHNFSKEWNCLEPVFYEVDKEAVYKDKSVFLCADSRVALSKFPDNSVSCIITSPPYGDLKNYGSENQIGFGQNWENEYLPDLESLFTELHRVSKSGAAMWVVLDMIKESGEMIPLPWEVIVRAKSAGWTFHDLVIWDKGKSLPWSSHGRFRGVCEYILLLGKGKLTNFDLDAVRDSENLSSYWVKYPERYHPDGKAPSDLWHFPIPVQGSWSSKQSRHYCPFPVGLVARMVSISSKKGDIVLDPFAGTGSVAAISSHLDRLGIGIEINKGFVEYFDTDGFDLIREKSKVELHDKNSTDNSLRETIINLRMLKYAKVLFSGLLRSDKLNSQAHDLIGAFFIQNTSQNQIQNDEHLDSGNLGQIKLQILLQENADLSTVREAVIQRMQTAPLSIFGIQTEIEFIPCNSWMSGNFTSSISQETWFIYKNGKFYIFEAEINKSQLKSAIFNEVSSKGKRVPSIFSNIKLSIDTTEQK